LGSWEEMKIRLISLDYTKVAKKYARPVMPLARDLEKIAFDKRFEPKDIVVHMNGYPDNYTQVEVKIRFKVIENEYLELRKLGI